MTTTASDQSERWYNSQRLLRFLTTTLVIAAIVVLELTEHTSEAAYGILGGIAGIGIGMLTRGKQ
jgi:hypothetical protein